MRQIAQICSYRRIPLRLTTAAPAPAPPSISVRHTASDVVAPHPAPRARLPTDMAPDSAQTTSRDTRDTPRLGQPTPPQTDTGTHGQPTRRQPEQAASSRRGGPRPLAFRPFARAWTWQSSPILPVCRRNWPADSVLDAQLVTRPANGAALGGMFGRPGRHLGRTWLSWAASGGLGMGESLRTPCETSGRRRKPTHLLHTTEGWKPSHQLSRACFSSPNVARRSLALPLNSTREAHRSLAWRRRAGGGYGGTAPAAGRGGRGTREGAPTLRVARFPQIAKPGLSSLREFFHIHWPPPDFRPCRLGIKRA